MCKTLVHRVKESIAANKLMASNGKYLVALSGGADSVALLKVLCALDYQVEAIHCNFQLRGEESDRDEAFCQQLCNEMGVKLHLVHFDTRAYAELHHVSIEMAARNLRYDYFERLCNDLGFSAICVAHHRDDSIETLLLNLVRGTGVHGLRGIAPQKGHILRPLLCVSRREIETYLKDIGQQYVTDSTNNEDEAVRNRIRHHVLPLLETINPSVRKSLSDTAHRMAEADKVLQRALDDAQSRLLETDGSDALPNKKIDVVELLKEPSPEYVLFHLLAPFQFTPDTIEDIASYMMNKGTSTTGKMWVSATHQMFLNRGKLLIAERNEEYSLRLRIPEPGVYGYTDVDGREHRIRVSLNEWKRGMNPSRSTSCVTLDSVDISFPLTLRYVAEGDRFVPFGMTGSKLISNFLTDQKRSIPEKRRQLVVENADGNLLWLLNNRPDNRYRCTSSTRSVIVLEDVSNH